MTPFIKCTSAMMLSFVYVNLDHIIRIESCGSGAELFTVDERIVRVTQTPDQIIAAIEEAYS